MRKKLAILVLTAIILLILALNYNFLYTRIVGLAVSNFNVTVEKKTSGKLLLSFQQILDLGDTQNIYTEFINTGSTPVTSKNVVYIYMYYGGTLRPIAYYYDISIPLNPGARRGYKTVFVPPYVGTYYIQARAPYDSNVVEIWSAFLVKYPPPAPSPITYPTAPTPFPIGLGIPKLSLVYPERVKILQGESTLFNITVKNIGEATLHNLKLYVSTTELINFAVYPKQIASLAVNDSTMFLVSINIPATTPESLYPFDFQLMSDEIKEERNIIIEVSSVPFISEEEEIRQKILNYELLIAKIEQDIASASLKGFDVSLAKQSLNNAKTNLEAAKNYFGLKNFQEAKNELEKVKKNLEDAVLRLASATLYVYKPLALAPFLILLIIIFIIVGIVAYYYYEKKKERRPKLLRALAESEGETEK